MSVFAPVLRMPARSRAVGVSLSLSLSAVLCVAPAAHAQQPQLADSAARRRPAADSSGNVTSLGKVTITATRTEKDVFSTPAPVTVIDSSTLQTRLPNSVVDPFRDLPGLDIAGVGTNQARPTIRGQRGQRILLLEDGLRLNNARRQQDFGELPALGGLTGLDRVEVVRGPLSVLYGTDAIGGVVNLISPELPFHAPSGGVRGALGMRYGTVGDQVMPFGSVQGRVGRLAYRAAGAYRETNPYLAPSGSFGNITLDRDTRVQDSGIRDHSFDVQLGWALTDRQRLTAKAERYQAANAGFGYVRTPATGTTEPLIELQYPNQRFTRYSLGYRASALGSVLADRVEITGYAQDNERDFDQHIFVPFGGGAGMTSNARNFTDLSTLGFRAEASKLVAGRHILTYGIDGFRDHSDNTDSSTTVITGYGPQPITQTSTRPQIPNASFRSAGVFVQGDLRLAERVSVILGARGQDVRAQTRPTPGITEPSYESHERTAVGAANLLVRATESLNLIAAVGRGFRSPNLVERFFDGPLPEGSAYQKRNLALDPETSVNVDVGARVRRGPVYAEAFVFRNDVRNGVKVVPTGDTINRLPVYQNVNIAHLRYTGAEVSAGVSFTNGIGVGANYTKLTGKDVSRKDVTVPVDNTYSDKFVADLRYRLPSGRFTAGYTLRYNGEQKDAVLGTNPLGPVLPAFTVHSLRASAVLFERGAVSHSLTATVDNLTNALYAEFANASFFRPEARRGLTLAWTTAF